MQNWDQEIKKQIQQLDIVADGLGAIQVSKEDEKKLKKKYKKYAIEQEDNLDEAINKTKKILDQLYKSYETTAKEYGKVTQLRGVVEAQRVDKDKAVSQTKMIEGLRKGFMKKYQELLKQAQDVEKQEEDKRKALIEQLQNRIKTVQQEYETSGKIKIDKYRENEILKHEISKLEPQVLTRESLYDAQLKKKQIEVEIQMTTMRQKIEMMNNFKSMGEQTKLKIEKSKAQEAKIQNRLQILDKKEEEHKILLARAHLVMDDYKKAIIKINELLGKKQKAALQGQNKVKRDEQALADIDKELLELDKQYETHKQQITMLCTLQQNLKKQLLAQ